MHLACILFLFFNIQAFKYAKSTPHPQSFEGLSFIHHFQLVSQLWAHCFPYDIVQTPVIPRNRHGLFTLSGYLSSPVFLS